MSEFMHQLDAEIDRGLRRARRLALLGMALAFTSLVLAMVAVFWK